VQFCSIEARQPEPLFTEPIYEQSVIFSAVPSGLFGPSANAPNLERLAIAEYPSGYISETEVYRCSRAARSFSDFDADALLGRILHEPDRTNREGRGGMRAKLVETRRDFHRQSGAVESGGRDIGGSGRTVARAGIG